MSHQTPGQERLHIHKIITTNEPGKAVSRIIELMSIDRGIARKEGREEGFQKAVKSMAAQRRKNQNNLKKSSQRLGFDLEFGE